MIAESFLSRVKRNPVEVSLVVGKVASAQEKSAIERHTEKVKSDLWREIGWRYEEALRRAGVWRGQIELMKEGANPNPGENGRAGHAIEFTIHHENLVGLGGRFAEESKRDWKERVGGREHLLVTTEFLHSYLHDLMQEISPNGMWNAELNQGEWRMMAAVKCRQPFLLTGAAELERDSRDALVDFVKRVGWRKKQLQRALPEIPEEAEKFFASQGMEAWQVLGKIAEKSRMVLGCWTQEYYAHAKAFKIIHGKVKKEQIRRNLAR
ncbi:MAG: hypothetical protein ACOY3I_04635 [Verrucomicrobiota bacterium]